jgi:hypothetical protein
MLICGPFDLDRRPWVALVRRTLNEDRFPYSLRLAPLNAAPAKLDLRSATKLGRAVGSWSPGQNQ